MTRFGPFGRALAVTVTTAAALSLAGCGDSGSSAGSAGAADSKKESTVKVDEGDAALSKDEIMTATTEAAVKAGSAHMTMKMTINGKQATDMTGDVSYAGGTSMQATMTSPEAGAGKMELRYVDNIVYLQIPGMTPAGKFMAIDPKDQSSPMAKSFAGLSEQMDPLASVKSLQSSVVSSERVGQETVQGTDVDHYEVVVDTAKMIAKLGEAAKQAQSQMPKTITYDFWLDQDNLIRKMTFELLGSSTEIEMSDWGKPVEVEAPAAGDTVKPPAAPGA